MGFFCATVSFPHFTLEMFSLVAIPANIFIANSKHLQTVIDASKVLKQIFKKKFEVIGYFRCRKFPLQCCAKEKGKEKTPGN